MHVKCVLKWYIIDNFYVQCFVFDYFKHLTTHHITQYNRVQSSTFPTETNAFFHQCELWTSVEARFRVPNTTSSLCVSEWIMWMIDSTLILQCIPVWCTAGIFEERDRERESTYALTILRFPNLINHFNRNFKDVFTHSIVCNLCHYIYL